MLWLIKPMPRSEDHSLLQKSYRCGVSVITAQPSRCVGEMNKIK